MATWEDFGKDVVVAKKKFLSWIFSAWFLNLNPFYQIAMKTVLFSLLSNRI